MGLMRGRGTTRGSGARMDTSLRPGQIPSFLPLRTPARPLPVPSAGVPAPSVQEPQRLLPAGVPLLRPPTQSPEDEGGGGGGVGAPTLCRRETAPTRGLGPSSLWDAFRTPTSFLLALEPDAVTSARPQCSFVLGSCRLPHLVELLLTITDTMRVPRGFDHRMWITYSESHDSPLSG